MIESREDRLKKWTELLEAASIEDLITNRDLFARWGLKDEEAIAQKILNRKVAIDCGKVPPAEATEEAPAPPPAIITPSQFPPSTVRGDVGSVAQHVDVISEANHADQATARAREIDALPGKGFSKTLTLGPAKIKFEIPPRSA